MEEVKRMSQHIVEKGFQLLHQSVEELQQALNTSFLDAYIENTENMLDGKTVRVVDGIPKEDNVVKIEKLYEELESLELSKEDKRKITQLVLLQGLIKEPVQANHQLTPDGIGFLFVYMIEQLTQDKKTLSIADLSVGTGNLLYTVLTNLELAGYHLKGFGVDADDMLLSAGLLNKDWIGLDVSLTHQDSLKPLLLDPVDIAISDLPIGYYPDDEQANIFETSVNEGHSYAHHLLMEQSMKHVSPDGFGLFLLPSNFLETEQADALKQWLVSTVYLQAIVKLPDSLFSQKGMGKSIVVVQNKGEHASQVKEVLLAELPSLKNNDAVLAFMNDFRVWRETTIK